MNIIKNKTMTTRIMKRIVKDRFFLKVLVLACLFPTVVMGQATQTPTLEEVFPFLKDFKGNSINQRADGNSVIIPAPNYSGNPVYSNGMVGIQYRVLGKYGFADSKGQIMKDRFIWDTFSGQGDPKFHCGAVIMRNSNDYKAYIIRKDGTKTLINGAICKATAFNDDGIAAVVDNCKLGNDVRSREYVKYINTKGQWVYRKCWTKYVNKLVNLSTFKNGRALFYDNYKKAYGIVNKQGVIVRQANLPAEQYGFSDEVARIYKGGSYSVIDMTGKELFTINGSNIDVDDFHCGHSVVKLAYRKFVMIDKTGKIVSKEYERMTPFFPNGLALAQRYDGDTEVLNTKMEVVRTIDMSISDRYNEKPFTPQYYKGVIDWNGCLADFYGNRISYDYYFIKFPVDGDLILVTGDNHKFAGYLNRVTGKIVSYFGEDEF